MSVHLQQHKHTAGFSTGAPCHVRRVRRVQGLRAQGAPQLVDRPGPRQSCHVAAVQAPAAAIAPTAAEDMAQDTTHCMQQGSAGYLQQHVVPAARQLLEQYAAPDAALVDLIHTPDLDQALSTNPSVVAAAAQVEQAVDEAVSLAYAAGEGGEQDVRVAGAQGVQRAAHLFLQRVLYQINRLNHFWYDDLKNYDNERSPWLAALRERVEGPWQQWELAQLEQYRGQRLDAYRQMPTEDIKKALNTRYERDVDPPLSPALTYVKESMSTQGYCHLLAMGALDGLVEASRQSRVCAGVANQPACTIFRVLLEEYGSGRYQKKHSTFYQTMMQELGLDATPESYLDLVPWQLLAGANHNFLMTERRRHYLRYAGALTFFETNGPSVYRAYLGAAQRLGLSEGACGYWALHIKEDERHGRQMTQEVALPLVHMYPHDAWELLWGYDQDLFMGARAGAAMVRDIQAAESAAGLLTS